MDALLLSLRKAALIYKASKTEKQRRRALIAWLDVSMAIAEERGAWWDDLAPGRDAAQAIIAFDGGSKHPLLEATGKRIGVEEHGRRATLAAGMEWLTRNGLDNRKAAHEALRLGKVRDVTSKQLIQWREELMGSASEADGDALKLARERFLRLTCADNFGSNDLTEIAKRILQSMVTKFPK